VSGRYQKKSHTREDFGLESLVSAPASQMFVKRLFSAWLADYWQK